MDCRDIQVLIQLHIDKQLDQKQEQLLLKHLSLCPECMAEAEAMLALDALLATELPAVPQLPEDFSSRVMADLPTLYAPVAKLPRKRRTRRFISIGALSACAAALLLAVGLGAGMQKEYPDNDSPPIIADNNTTDQNDQNTDPVQPNNDPLNNTEGNTPNPNGEENDPPNNDVTIDNNTDNTSDDNSGNPDGIIDTPTPPDNVTISGITLPPVAGNSEEQGSYSQITLAAIENSDALMPRVAGNIVNFYAQIDGIYLEWQVAADGSSAPVFVGECESLPGHSGMGRYVSDETGSYYSDTAADGMLVASNKADGLWINDQPVCEIAGGYLIDWAPDNSKLLFSDAQNNLWLFYHAEGYLLQIASMVSDACWNGNGHIVFSGYDASSGYNSIFRVSVP